MIEQPDLRTERLLLRPFILADVDDLTALVGHKDIASTTLRIPHPYDKQMAVEWISSHEQRLVRESGIVFAVTSGEDGTLVGSIGLVIEKEFRRAELGYWIGKPYWNQGYATEAAAAVIRFGFEELDLNRIFAAHLVRNPSSGRVMEKNGMKFEGCFRQHVFKWGKFEDLNYFAILREDFRKE